MAGQWTADIYQPGSSSPDATLDREILKPSIGSEHTGHWDAQIEVAPTFDPESFRFGRMDLYYGGDLEVSVKIEPPIGGGGGDPITLGGRTRNTLRLTDREIEREFSDVLTHDALQQVWDQDTDFDATVHPPTPHPFTDRLVQQADGSNLADILTARHRDEEGRFVAEQGDTAPNFLDSTPLAVVNEGVRQTPTAFVAEGEAADDYREVSVGEDVTTGECSGQERLGAFNTDNGMAEWSFALDHTIPEGAGAVAIRGRLVSYSASTSSSYAIDIDDQTAATLTDGDINAQDTGESPYAWVHVGQLDTEISGGESHTLGFKTLAAGDRAYHIDVVCVFDSRFSHEFSTHTNDDAALAHPSPHPPQTEFTFDSPDVGAVIESTDLSVSVDQDNDRWGSSTQIRGATSSHVESTVTLAPNSDPDKTTTPTDHTIPQTLTDMELRIDGDARSIIDSQQFAGTPFEILQQLHDRANYHWAVEHGREDGALVAESFERGDSGMARALPPDARVADVSQDTSVSGEYHNRVTVVGDELPPGLRREGEPRRYRATVEDSGEIADGNGVEQITIEDSELNTQNDVLSRARSELRKGLAADETGGSIDTTPALVEPGYPYRVPELASEDPHAPRLGGVSSVRQLGDVASGEIEVVGPGSDFGPRGEVFGDITIAGTLYLGDGGLVRVRDRGSITVADSGALTVSDGATLTTDDETRLADTVTVGPGEPLGSYVEVWTDITVTGSLTVADGGHVFVLPGASLTEGTNGTIAVETGGTIERAGGELPLTTLESWSVGESAGSASANGGFERRGGVGGSDRAALLGLLADD